MFELGLRCIIMGISLFASLLVLTLGPSYLRGRLLLLGELFLLIFFDIFI
jgi:hypothetical protein